MSSNVKCGELTEVFSRVTGYLRPISRWNDGKKQEFEDRKTYSTCGVSMKPVEGNGKVSRMLSEEVREALRKYDNEDDDVKLFNEDMMPKDWK